MPFYSKKKIELLNSKIESLEKYNEYLQRQSMVWVQLYNEYHNYYINKECITAPRPYDEDAWAEGIGAAMVCSKCGKLVGSDDYYCRKCGVKLKYDEKR